MKCKEDEEESKTQQTINLKTQLWKKGENKTLCQWETLIEFHNDNGNLGTFWAPHHINLIPLMQF